MRAHALLSASGAQRWLACTPSARLEDSLSDTKSDYAAEGSEAHKLAEIQLSYALGQISKDQFVFDYDNFRSSAKFYNHSMQDTIDDYCASVMEIVNFYDNPIVELECRLDFSRWVPEGFGTADVVIVADDTFHVIDLKYGTGVPVDAIDNPQLRFYALGVLEKYDLLGNFRSANLTIKQPRIYRDQTELIPIRDLIKWADDVVKPAAQKAYRGEGDYSPSENTCRFCRAASTCRARSEYILMQARYYEFGTDLLETDEIAELLKKTGDIQRWAKDLEAYALEQAGYGVTYPGWKLVEGRSNRRYKDEVAVMKTLRNAGYSTEKITTTELLSISQLEKAIGKKRIQELLSDLIVKPQGKPVLVPESDPRPIFNDALEDFADAL